ncbi:Oye3p [Sugiyamaella lignohabitans]|uniref:Oye3p n=1 Tax=Sugiyamaella lignohabitans TaxID=796027 RepID=A0A167C7Q0_9ASCO|nr:Oye3p [Sugiyamaella lignohabitans]ANB11324.1 Oye3p [Sugiyamaella lignohabitans]
MTVTSTTPALYTPIKLGNVNLEHRVAMAPLTRFRTPNHIPPKAFAQYYEQRASRPGTFIITEATVISPKAGGYDNVPGIWSQEQIEGWKQVYSKINAKGSFAFLQLWAIGRVADPSVLEKEGITSGLVSASDVAVKNGATPRALTKAEIKEYIEDYVKAAKNAIEAGAAGVEIHGANGYLPDQFLHENTNRRTDEYGGSIENRARFVLEVVDALIEAVGAEKVSIRLSPWSSFNEVEPGVSPIPQWSYIITELEKRAQEGNRLAYIHLVEPRVDGSVDRDDFAGSNEFARNIWQGIILRAGGLVHDAEKLAEEDSKTIVALGRYFISNPDLVNRLEQKVELTPYDRSTFYATEPTDVSGYLDYKTATQ